LRSCSGCFTLRRAQLEQELLGVEDRLRYIATERAMPADDIVAKKVPALGVVVIAAPAPGNGATRFA
jgi:hypothetical protein